MGKFLNSRRWVGDLMLFEALAGGASDHLQIYKLPTHWGIGTKFFIQVKCWEGGGGEVAWAVFELTGTLSWVAGYYSLPKKHDKCFPDTLLEGWGGGE